MREQGGLRTVSVVLITWKPAAGNCCWPHSGLWVYSFTVTRCRCIHSLLLKGENSFEKIHFWSDRWLADTGNWRFLIYQNGDDAGGNGLRTAADGREDRAYGAERAHG